MTPPDDVQLSRRYRLITEIGRGGMGEVCLAVAHGVAGFKKLVVVKRARPDIAKEPDCLAMFLDEARIAARLNHPNVVQTYEAGQSRGRYFIAMEYLDGQSLHQIRDRIEPQWFPLSMQIRILIDALAGLHHAHELVDFDGTPLFVVHRDVTPQNIFVTYEGQSKVVDFGIAKAASSTTTTYPGIIRGTVRYMAPEQARCEEVDRRADIFAVGVMLWEAITGARMWRGISDTEIVKRLTMGKLPRLEASAPNCDPEIHRICLRALAPRPAHRHLTAAALQHELERWLARQGEEVPARVVGTFVAAHFEEERVALRVLIEDAGVSSAPWEGIGEKPAALEIEQTWVDSKLPSRYPMETSVEPSAAGIAPREGSDLAQDATIAGEGYPLEASVTVRSPTEAPMAVDTPLTALGCPRFPRGEPLAMRALDRGPSESSPLSEEPETLRRFPVSTVPVVASLSPPRLSRWPWGLPGIRGAGLLAGAVVASALVLRVSQLWLDRHSMLPLGSMASVDALVSVAPARAENAPANPGELDLTVHVLPTTARIFLDGAPVSAGWYKDKIAKDGQVHRIRVEAPNFVSMEQWITASSDVIISMALERKPARVP
jgi:hypothetical protein